MGKHKEKTQRDFTSFFAQRRGGPGEWSPTCKECRKQKPWGKLLCKYEMRTGDLFRVWFCTCGNMVREDNMTDLALAMEAERGQTT